MWPFKRKRRELAFWISRPMPGIERLPDGSLEMSYTEEEQDAVTSYMKMMQRMADQEAESREGKGARATFHPDVEPIFRAIGLSQYGNDLSRSMEFGWDETKRDQAAPRIIAALTKAYSLSEFPIFIYDLARVFEGIGENALAKDLFAEFLDENQHFKQTSMYEIYLQQRNLREAVREAKSKSRRM
jgi:hypothetical protein